LLPVNQFYYVHRQTALNNVLLLLCI